MTTTTATRTRRPASVTATIAALGVLGVSALGGGVEMLAFRHGNAYVPAEWLEEIPLVDSYVVPGVILGGVFGVGSLVTGLGVLRRRPSRMSRFIEQATRRHWSWGLTVALGVAFAAWLATEAALIGGPGPEATTDERVTAYATRGVFYAVAAALLTMPHTRGVRRHLDRTPSGRAVTPRSVDAAASGSGPEEARR